MLTVIVTLAVLALLAYGWWNGWRIVRIMAWPVFVVICAVPIALVMIEMGIEPRSPTAYLAWPIAIVAGWYISGLPIKLRQWQARRTKAPHYEVYLPPHRYHSTND